VHWSQAEDSRLLEPEPVAALSKALFATGRAYDAIAIAHPEGAHDQRALDVFGGRRDRLIHPHHHFGGFQLALIGGNSAAAGGHLRREVLGHQHGAGLRERDHAADFVRELADVARPFVQDQVLQRPLGQRPFAMLLLAGFATLALVLASVGLYSVLAYTVRQRVCEIGIRLALGAPTLLRTIVIEGLKPTLVGVAVGLVLAAALGGVLSTLLYGVGVHDLGTYARVGGLVVVVGIVATLLPAYRATRVDPIVTLRAE